MAETFSKQRVFYYKYFRAYYWYHLFKAAITNPIKSLRTE